MRAPEIKSRQHLLGDGEFAPACKRSGVATNEERQKRNGPSQRRLSYVVAGFIHKLLRDETARWEYSG
jgi:hypothetical protein